MINALLWFAGRRVPPFRARSWALLLAWYVDTKGRLE